MGTAFPAVSGTKTELNRPVVAIQTRIPDRRSLVGEAWRYVLAGGGSFPRRVLEIERVFSIRWIFSDRKSVNSKLEFNTPLSILS